MPETLATRFNAACGERDEILERARECAALTLPWQLPPDDHDTSQKLPEAFNSLGGEMVRNLGGRILSALFPAELTWFRLATTASLRLDDSVPSTLKADIEKELFKQEVVLQALLESVGLVSKSNRRPAGFRSQMWKVIQQLLITGDTLFSLTDDYRIVVYGRDQYTIRRDTAGDLLEILIKERKYAPNLTDETLSKAKIIRAELDKKPHNDRYYDLYTSCEWDENKKAWRWTQELNDIEVESGSETVSRYISVPMDLAPGENYGRGLTEANLAELRTLNELEQRSLEAAGLASMGLIALDHDSPAQPQSLEKPPGSVVRLRVQGGKIQDAALFKADNYPDFKVVREQVTDKEQRLARRFLLQSGAVRDSERTTAYEIARVTIAELDGGLGGMYTGISDPIQLSLLQRLYFQAQRDKLVAKLTANESKVVEVKLLTGAAALASAAKAQRLIEFTELVKQVTPEQQDRINDEVLFNALSRYGGVDEPGLIRTDAEVQKVREDRAKIEAQLMAAQAAAQTAGTVVQNAAAAPQG